MPKLTKDVLAGGRVFPAGTSREDDAADVIPDGPWWDSQESPKQSAEKPQEPPRSGRGSGVDAWREYADSLGVQYPQDATRDDIVALIDQN